jgi:type IV conjugative transfer system coupling protein TraD
MGLFAALAEGGQTWAHRVRMVRQVFKIAVLVSSAFGLLHFIYEMQQLDQGYYQTLWYYTKSLLMLPFKGEIDVDSEFWGVVSSQYHSYKTITLNTQTVFDKCEKLLPFFWRKAKAIGSTSLFISTFAFSFFLLFFSIRGLFSKKKKHLSGKKIRSATAVALKLKMRSQASPVKIGSLPLVKGTETQHILVSGGTGSGKTNCFHHILPRIKNLSQKAIIVDTTGILVSKYFREGKDILLNPFNSNSEQWHPWVECKDSFDYDSIAQSFIPMSPNDRENYWRVAGASVLSSLLQKFEKDENKKIQDLSETLLNGSLKRLCEEVVGTKAAAHLDISSEKTAASIRSVTTSFVSCLEYLKNSDHPFSIRDWIEKKDDDSWLFLSCKLGERAALNPLISTWSSIAIRSLLQMEPDINRRVWFVIDELPSLQKLKDLETLLTEGRKFGACGLLALQSPAQLESIYGHEISRVILGNCATRISFYEQDPEIATRISKIFGDSEFQETQEGLSYGAHEMRDGVTLSKQKKMHPVVSASDIQSLRKQEAYVKLPGKQPIIKMRLKLIV